MLFWFSEKSYKRHFKAYLKAFTLCHDIFLILSTERVFGIQPELNSLTLTLHKSQPFNLLGDFLPKSLDIYGTGMNFVWR